MKVDFKSRKLKTSIIKVTDKVKDNPGLYKHYIVYGVTKDEGISLTGNVTSEDLSEYIVVDKNTFAFNPYRINIGSIGLSGETFKGLVSPAYVVFKTKDDLLPEFLFSFLKSDIGIKLINWYGNRGGVRNALRFDDLGEIDIPDLTIAEQETALAKIITAQRKLDLIDRELEFQQTHLQKLRQSILQEAVQGKLTKQAPKDEPAEKLLQRIKAEKQKLRAAGKLKKEKELPPITEDEIRFDLPKGWVWCRLGEISKLQNGYAFQSSKYQSEGIRLVRNINIGHGKINWDETAFYPENLRESFQEFELNENDILISLDRPIIATGLKIAKVTQRDLPSLLLQRVGRINALELKINPDYIYMWFNSPLFIEEITPGRSNGVPHISTKEIENLLLPLPPISEQQRIVAKVQQLIQLVNELEQQLEENKMQGSNLEQAVLKNAFGDDTTIVITKAEQKQAGKAYIYKPDNQYFYNMKILEILSNTKQPILAANLWKQSEFKDDIEGFYAELKRLIDIDKTVVEEKIGKDSYLKPATDEN
jgi:restriction endonuclease S subunit